MRLRNTLAALIAAVALLSGAARADAAPGHLYVGDAATGTIVRFPLTGGLPSTTPDLTIPYAFTDYLAVDSAGNLYASASGGGSTAIFIYDSSGTRIGGLGFDFDIGGLAIDAKGDVFVVVGSLGNVVLVYPPGSNGTHAIAALRGDAASALAVGPDQRLYEMTTDNFVGVFDRPLVNSKLNERIGPPRRSWILHQALAFDENDDVYAAFAPAVVSSPWDDEDFTPLATPNGPMRSPAVMARDCSVRQTGAPQQPGTVTAMTVFGGYLTVACYGSKAPAVYVYRIASGRQPALERLPGLSSPRSLALAP